MSSQSSFAKRTACTPMSMIWPRDLRNLCFRWVSDVPRTMWIRGRFAGFTASATATMSDSTARARAVITGPSTCSAMFLTAAKSPGEDAAKPASITSTPSLASWWATWIFSSRFSEAPGTCSPSRRVVSKISTFRIAACSCLRPTSSHRSSSSCCAAAVRPPRSSSPTRCAAARA